MTNRALDIFTAKADVAQTKIDKFKDLLDKDPTRALAASMCTFEATATLSVAKMIIYSLTDHPNQPAQSVSEVYDTLLNKVIQGALYPAQSSSVTYNLMNQCEHIAYAEALNILKNMR